MSLEINSPRATTLACELAAATGEDIDTAVVRALEERLVRVTWQAGSANDDEIETVFEKLAGMPVLDARHPDEILGYGPNGLPC